MEPSLPFDAVPPGEARRLLHACCGSARWVDGMLARRPFGTAEALLAAARDVWFGLSNADWREAFRQHPKIGDRDSLRRRFTATSDLAAREQAGVDAASEEVFAALAAGNREYENAFGHIFIVFATGRTAGEMLEMLRERLENDPHIELRIAAEEQAKITDLRLRELCVPVPPEGGQGTAMRGAS